MALKMIDTSTGEIRDPDPVDDEFAYRTENDDIDDVIEEDDRPEEGEDEQDNLTRGGDEIVEGGRYQHTGNCIYCGQARMIYTARGLEDQRKLDEFATMRCTCEPALEYQQRVGCRGCGSGYRRDRRERHQDDRRPYDRWHYDQVRPARAEGTGQVDRLDRRRADRDHEGYARGLTHEKLQSRDEEMPGWEGAAHRIRGR